MKSTRNLNCLRTNCSIWKTNLSMQETAVKLPRINTYNSKSSFHSWSSRSNSRKLLWGWVIWWTGRTIEKNAITFQQNSDLQKQPEDLESKSSKLSNKRIKFSNLDTKRRSLEAECKSIIGAACIPKRVKEQHSVSNTLMTLNASQTPSQREKCSWKKRERLIS